ncbi:MAG TPA: hypothetical protein ACFYEK_11315 [Candidatus Wunengus sp. YC60]|uniref:hypothetical protein n=1 Tax=Candidatus Wunengus sp. YC60 TaxID=3367697 RepID=UPI004029187C
MTEKNNKLTEPAKTPSSHKPMNTWKHMVAYVCIWFLVIVLVMVYFTSTGSPQAGLLEVGVSALIFAVLFHLVMKFFPLVSKIITSVIVIGFGIALIFVNYHYLKVVKKDASLEQLLVGDLLVHKILKTIKKEPIALVTKEEIPKTVLEPTYEKPSLAISLDQVKTTIAAPITAGTNLEFLHITPPAPVIKTGTAFMTEKYKMESYVGNMTEEISRLTFITKEREPIVQQVTEEKYLTPLLLLEVIRETPTKALKDQEIQRPISEMTASIHMIKLCEPIKEGRMPVN